MAEEKNIPVPEDKKQETARPESELAAELERVRSRNKILKVTAAVLAILFMALATAAFVTYRKVSQTKAAIESAFQNYQPPSSVLGPEGLPMPGSGPSVLQSTAMASSGLGLFSGSIPGEQPEAARVEEAGKIVNAMAKYSDQPVVKEFLADLKKDPDVARALAQSKGRDPMAVLASVRNAKGVNALMAKYITRPDFLKVMMEVMKDPDMKHAMSSMPMGGGMPQAVPVAAGPAEEAQQEEEAGNQTLDPSAISGPFKTAPARAQKAPPPVDIH